MKISKGTLLWAFSALSYPLVAQFSTENPIITGISLVKSIVPADLDKDGDMDVLATTSAYVLWYENEDGKGGFSQHKILQKGTTPAIPADLDQDGDLDIIAGKDLILNQGSGLFAAPLAKFPVAPTGTADIDGDGDPDPVITTVNNPVIRWSENLGNNQFGTATDLFSFSGLNTYFVFDLDKNQKGDFIIANGDSLRLFLNQGNGIFIPVFLDQSTVSRIRVADVDKDGWMDVLAGSRIQGTIYWYKNPQTGTQWGPAQLVTNNYANADRDFAAGDLDGDGYPEVVFDAQAGKMSRCDNNNGIFDPVPATLKSYSSFNQTMVFCPDFNSDGYADILAGSNLVDAFKILWYRNLQDGTFSEREPIAQQVNSLYEIYAADLDQDNDLDLITTTSDDQWIAWIENLGNKTFGRQRLIFPNNYGGNYVRAADMDGDGDNDIVAGLKGISEVVWFENPGNGLFDQTKKVIGKATLPFGAVPADLDGDGDMDVVSACGTLSLPNNETVLWFENDGKANFSEHIVATDVGIIRRIIVADYNGDTLPDLILHNTSLNCIQVLDNLGQGNFGPLKTLITGLPSNINRFFVTDLSGDLQPDMLFSQDNGTATTSMFWYRNLGGGLMSGIQYIAQPPIPINITRVEVFPTDLDQDQKTDILVSSVSGKSLSWYRNTGGAQFEFGNVIFSNTDATAFDAAYAFDVDGDGDADPLCYMYKEGLGGNLPDDLLDDISWFENLMTPPEPAIVLKSMSVGCFDNDSPENPADDKIVLSLFLNAQNLSSLTYNLSLSQGEITPATGAYGQNKGFEFQEGSAGGGDILLTIRDGISDSVALQIPISDPGPCSVVSTGAAPQKDFALMTSPNPFRERLTFTVQPGSVSEKTVIQVFNSIGMPLAALFPDANGQCVFTQEHSGAGMLFYTWRTVNTGQILQSGKVLYR